jgi:hypothetical protein
VSSDDRVLRSTKFRCDVCGDELLEDRGGGALYVHASTKKYYRDDHHVRIDVDAPDGQAAFGFRTEESVAADE